MPLLHHLVHSSIVAVLFLTLSCGNEPPASDTSEEPPAQTVTQTATAPTAEAPKETNIDYCAFVTMDEIASVIQCNGEITTTPQSNSHSNRCTYRCIDPYTQVIVNFTENEGGFTEVINRKKDNAALTTLELEGADAVFLMEGQMRFDIYRDRWAITLFSLGVGAAPKASGLAVAKAILAKL